MITVRITGTLDGDTVIDRALRGIEERANDITPAAPAVFQAFRAIAARAFATEGASTAAGAWRPLAKSTVAQRRHLGYGPEHPILQRTQRLFRSVAERTGDTIEVVSDRYLGIGSAVEHIQYHQSRAPRAFLPRRAIVELTTDDKHELTRPLRRYLTGHDPDAPVRSRIG